MNKFLAAFILLIVLGVAVHARAAESDAISVKVTMIASLSVDISETELGLGSVGIGTSTASTTGITVTNTGSGIPETYSLNLTNPAGWTASDTAAGVETYVLNSAFDADGVITWGAVNHALSTIPGVCTDTKFADDQNGVSVPYNETRILWFQFLSPIETSVTTEQSIAVTITAQAG